MERRRIWQLSIGLSVAIHLIALMLLLVIPQMRPDQDTHRDSPIVVEILPPKKDKSLIVESNEGKIVKEAPEDAYLSDANRVVEEEKSAKITAPLQEKQAKQNRKSGQKSQQTQGNETPVPLAKLGVPLFQNPLKQAMRENAPEWHDYQQDHQEVRQGEYVKGLAEGETSALNTREFVYFSYFKRIRDRLDHAWRPILSDKLTRAFRMGRTLASDLEHTTKTLVTLNKLGRIVRIQVLEASGSRDLDDAAVRAFNQAGPFPNPPRDILDNDGLIRLRWDFILKT